MDIQLDNQNLSYDPNTVYHSQSRAVDVAEEAQTIANYATSGFVYCFAPFLIISPFFVQKLSILNRKVTAMMVLSDTIKFIGDIAVAMRSKTFSADLNAHIVECTVVS